MSNINEINQEYELSDFIISEASKLGKYLLLNRELIIKLGGNASILLTDIIYRWRYFKSINKLDQEGFFFYNQEDIEKSTGFSSYVQLNCIKKLEELQLVSTKIYGSPPRKYYRPLMIQVLSFLDFKFLETKNSSSKKLRLSRINKEDSNKENLTPKGVRLNRRSDSSIILSFWNSLSEKSSLRVHRRNTKIFNKASNKIATLRKRGYSIEEIKEAILKYSELVDSEYTVIKSQIPGHLVSIDQFFCGFEKYTMNKLKKYKKDNPIDQSTIWFEECIKYDVMKKYADKKKEIEDEYPRITRRIKKLFVKEILGDIRPKSFSLYDENCFIISSKRFIQFLQDNESRLNISEKNLKYPHKLVDLIFSAIRQHVKDDMSRVTPGWLSSNITFEKHLPTYLHQQAMLSEKNKNSEDWSIYDRESW